MIKIKCINGVPEQEIPNNILGIKCDGHFYSCFETEQEVNEYENSIPKTTEIKVREVSNWKLKAILDSMGLIGNVTTALNSLEEPTKTIANYAWEYADVINQYSPTTQLIKEACNLTDEQVEAIFTNAEKINI